MDVTNAANPANPLVISSKFGFRAVPMLRNTRSPPSCATNKSMSPSPSQSVTAVADQVPAWIPVTTPGSGEKKFVSVPPISSFERRSYGCKLTTTNEESAHATPPS